MQTLMLSEVGKYSSLTSSLLNKYLSTSSLLLLFFDHEVLDFEGFCILAAQHITQAASELIISVHVTPGPGNNPAWPEKSEVTFLSFADCSASESLLLNRQTRVATLPDIDNKQLSYDNVS